MQLTLIAAMANNRVIGSEGDMPWHLPEDLAFFKRNTRGKPILMGRKTFLSIGCQPLPKRQNIVLTRDHNYQSEGITVVHSLKEAIDAAQDAPELMVCGGSHIYSLCLPHAHRLLITYIDCAPEGDTFFPEWHHDEWQETHSDGPHTDEVSGLSYRFATLERQGTPDAITAT